MQKNIIKIVVGLLIFGLAYKLRLSHYDQIPLKGQSVDEYSYSWVGLSLIRYGVPVGISGLGGYRENNYQYINVDDIYYNGDATDGSPMPINYPWFDHPPAMGLVSGGYAYLKGARVFEDLVTGLIRKPMVILGSLSCVLVYILVTINFSFKQGIMAGLVYAVGPLAVISSRMVQAENGLIVISLLSLCFYSISRKRKGLKWWWLTVLTAGVGIWFKLSARFIGISLLILEITDRKERLNTKKTKVLILAIVLITFLLAFVAYRYVLDWHQFKNILISNSDRVYGIGLNSMFELIRNSKLTNNKFVNDPYYWMGWIMIFGSFSKMKKNKLFLVPTIVYLCVYIFFGSYAYGWYSFPFIPYLAMATGVMWSNNNRLVILSNLIIGGFWLDRLGLNSQSMIFAWRIGIPMILLVILLGCKKNSLLYRLMMWVVVLINTYLSLMFLATITPESWYGIS